MRPIALLFLGVLALSQTPTFADKPSKEPPSASDAKEHADTNGTKAKPDEAKPKAAEEAESDEKEETPKPVTISGVLEAIESTEIVADTEHFTSLELKRILPHGSRVAKGANVVWFETEDLDKQIKTAETELRLAKLKREDDEFAFKQFVETQKLDREAAERKRKQAQQKFDNYTQVDRDREVMTAEFNLKSSRASLENAREELQQLEQMYKEDDLTEESEEIVLKRAKQSVEFAEYRLQGTEISSDRTVKQNIPRTEAQQADSLARAQMEYEKSLRELVSARTRKDIERARDADKFKEQETKVAELRAERKKSVLKSPIAGIVLHGKLNRGRLSEKPSTLDAGSKVTASQVIATVVSPTRLRIRLALEEKNLSTVSVGTKCKVKTKAVPEFEAKGVVKSVSTVAYAGSKFDCVVQLQTKKLPEQLTPTMSCDLEFPTKEASKEQGSGKAKNKKAKQPGDRNE
jgi:multidrug resistance efflux pump